MVALSQLSTIPDVPSIKYWVAGFTLVLLCLSWPAFFLFPSSEQMRFRLDQEEYTDMFSFYLLIHRWCLNWKHLILWEACTISAAVHFELPKMPKETSTINHYQRHITIHQTMLPPSTTRGLLVSTWFQHVSTPPHRQLKGGWCEHPSTSHQRSVHGYHLSIHHVDAMDQGSLSTMHVPPWTVENKDSTWFHI